MRNRNGMEERRCAFQLCGQSSGSRKIDATDATAVSFASLNLGGNRPIGAIRHKFALIASDHGKIELKKHKKDPFERSPGSGRFETEDWKDA